MVKPISLDRNQAWPPKVYGQDSSNKFSPESKDGSDDDKTVSISEDSSSNESSEAATGESNSGFLTSQTEDSGPSSAPRKSSSKGHRVVFYLSDDDIKLIDKIAANELIKNDRLVKRATIAKNLILMAMKEFVASNSFQFINADNSKSKLVNQIEFSFNNDEKIVYKNCLHSFFVKEDKFPKVSSFLRNLLLSSIQRQ
jgi:hypothetical protein